jgi:hypothetical protein
MLLPSSPPSRLDGVAVVLTIAVVVMSSCRRRHHVVMMSHVVNIVALLWWSASPSPSPPGCLCRCRRRRGRFHWSSCILNAKVHMKTFGIMRDECGRGDWQSLDVCGCFIEYFGVGMILACHLRHRSLMHSKQHGPHITISKLGPWPSPIGIGRRRNGCYPEVVTRRPAKGGCRCL